MSSMSQATPASKKLFGHPRGLWTLFLTEMWERASYYGMRGLLILFLVASVQTGGFGLSDQSAAAIYGMYVGLVYLMALPGGWVADRLIGHRRAVFVGGCFIAAGHFSMAIPIVPTFYLGLCLIIIGTGLLKPNVSTMVGDLYPESGARRDAGFSIFYSGINLGAFFGPLVCGYLGERVNWHWGFSAAGVGMLFGLVQYQMGGKYLGGAGLRQDVDPAAERRGWKHLWAVVLATAAVLLGAALLTRTGVLHLTLHGVAQGLGYFMLALAIAYFGAILLLGRLTVPEKKRIFVIFVFFLAAVLFWAGYEQAGSSLNLFAERLTNLHVGSWEMPASWLQSVNPIFIIVLSPVFGILWVKWGSRAPSTPAKMGWGLVMVAIGFFVVAWGAAYAQGGAKVSMAWLIVTYFFHTAGELCLSPVGLSSVTKLAPRRLVGQMMGTWFMGTALGNLIAGLAAGGFAGMSTGQLFGAVGKVIGIAGVILLIISRPLKSLIGQENVPAAVPVSPQVAVSEKALP